MIIVRYAEIFLKGDNRREFERLLIENIRATLKQHNSNMNVNSSTDLAAEPKIKINRNRILVADDKATYLKDVPGIASISVAKQIELNLEILKKEAFALAKSKEHEFNSFKIDTKRVNKDIDLNSMDVDRLVGEEIFEKLNKRVDLKNPDLTIYFELIDEAYMFTQKIQGIGGLPLGVEGRVFALVEDEAGLMAAKTIMRRGTVVYPIYFKENEFAKKIQALAPLFKIKEIKITNLVEIASLAEKLDVSALVVPDKINSIKDYNTGLPILRPLISVTL